MGTKMTLGLDADRLTQEQFDEMQKMLVPTAEGVPVRFLKDGQALNIVTGKRASKGSNVIYHPVYWNFTRETARLIADQIGARAVFSE